MQAEAATSTRLRGRPLVSSAASDDELARRASAGDEAAFEVIMRRHNRLLFRTARSILKIDAEAEDALQEAYLRAWRALSTFRAESKLSTWLVRIVSNEALGRLRQRGASVIPFDSTMDTTGSEAEQSMDDDPDQRPECIAMRADVRRLVEARIDALPQGFRTVFVLRAVEEWSVEEIAQALQLPEATVRTRYFRARGLLREGLSRDIDLALGDAFSFAGARCDRIVAGVLAELAKDRCRHRS
ncbi:MAG: RNA polymerase sigma factor [Burkholderiaceae bacterium]|jgi:RNA polymerase sigma-70 factor (ECF subfamily)|nr:RNA polymerase sigma factor [Burkholderiaceae bacterium]